MEVQLDQEWKLFLQSEPRPRHFALATDLARKYGLRGADALHLATALDMNERFKLAGDEMVLWSADHELLEAADKTGIRVENPVPRQTVFVVEPNTLTV
jgi:predicted nucleic acid-binding protein